MIRRLLLALVPPALWASKSQLAGVCGEVTNTWLQNRTKNLEQQLGNLYVQEGLPFPTQKYVRGIGLAGMGLDGYSTGGGAMVTDLELFIRLADSMPSASSIVGIGNAFGYSTLALALLFPSAKIAVIDAETEGRANAFGSNITRQIAARHRFDTQ